MLTFISRTLLQRTNYSERQSVSHEGIRNSTRTYRKDYMCHCYLRQDGLGAVIVTDKEYPSRIAFNLETRLLDDFDAKYMYVVLKTIVFTVQGSLEEC